MKTLDLATSRFIVTSKSGGTAETLAQAIATLSAVKAAGLEAQIPNLFLGITEPRKPGKANGLRTLFAKFGIPMLEHHTGIGGRFSCLTNVGLMPAMARGLDARAIRAGAKSVIDALLAAETTARLRARRRRRDGRRAREGEGHRHARDDALRRPAGPALRLVRATLGGKPRQGRRGHDADRRARAARPAQPAAALHGRPARALSDDPARRQRRHRARRSTRIWRGIAGADMLGGHTVGDIVAAQAHAVPEALARAGRPVRTIDVAKLDEKALGALLMHFMIETILAGRLLGVDPFDQPAVELAKILTKERLAKGA